jgi:hypothetical protein
MMSHLPRGSATTTTPAGRTLRGGGETGCLALNVILGDGKRIVARCRFALAVMLEGIPLVRRLNQVEVAAPFDLVIASPGGHPKDVNVYQAESAGARGTGHAPGRRYRDRGRVHGRQRQPSLRDWLAGPGTRR